jgi:hypothetical protein
MAAKLDVGEVLYANPFSRRDDIASFRLEGEACITFPRGRMRMENAYERDKEKGLHANFILWCPEEFGDHIAVSWDFRPRTDAGLAMIWIAAKGRNGEDLFDPALAPRDGNYPQYFKGDINALHGSYYRRNPSEIGFRTCNLRKSHGATGFYRVKVVKSGPDFVFSINDLVVYHWIDDGTSFGPVLAGGKIGFRQMAGLVGEYRNLEVRSVVRA